MLSFSFFDMLDFVRLEI